MRRSCVPKMENGFWPRPEAHDSGQSVTGRMTLDLSENRIKRCGKNVRNERCGPIVKYVPGHVHQRVERVEGVPERVAAVLFGHVRRRRHRLAAVALLHTVLDYVVD